MENDIQFVFLNLLSKIYTVINKTTVIPRIRYIVVISTFFVEEI